MHMEVVTSLALSPTYHQPSPYQNVEVKEGRGGWVGKGKGKSRRAEIVDDCCGRWRGDDCDRRRRKTVVVGSDGSNSILVFNKNVAT